MRAPSILEAPHSVHHQRVDPLYAQQAAGGLLTLESLATLAPTLCVS